jgi:hypothetical protein
MPFLQGFGLSFPRSTPTRDQALFDQQDPTSTDRTAVQLYCSSCVLTVVTVVTVVTDLYFTSDVFHPIVGASEMNSQEIGSKGHQKSGTV